MATFWVLENTVNNYTKIHVGNCISCNDGQGLRLGRTGFWHGPYSTYTQALARARNTGRNMSRVNCKHCWPESVLNR